VKVNPQPGYCKKVFGSHNLQYVRRNDIIMYIVRLCVCVCARARVCVPACVRVYVSNVEYDTGTENLEWRIGISS